MVLSLWLRAIARVHAVHLMNADSAPDGCHPPDQAKQLGLLPSTSTNVIITQPVS